MDTRPTPQHNRASQPINVTPNVRRSLEIDPPNSFDSGVQSTPSPPTIMTASRSVRRVDYSGMDGSTHDDFDQDYQLDSCEDVSCSSMVGEPVYDFENDENYRGVRKKLQAFFL